MSYNCANEISFWKLLQEFKVKIPIIQRDYAQGRLGKEYLRNNFLINLKQALDGKLPNGQKSLKLDFVYGEEKKGILYPLDGQQRLTTLWLLHWYVALKSGKLEDAAERLKNFTYETRISSREFCENLCNSVYFKDFDGCNVVDYIAKQTWFCSVWKQDPTIQSMLRMLKGSSDQEKGRSDIDDGIEKIFSESQNIFESYWEKISGENCPIVFYHLPLTNFGLSDDLYVKMNARGKQLTSFENFKADLIGYVKQCEKESDEWKKLLDPQKGIPIKFDTIWTDLFWHYRSTGDENGCLSNSIDEIFFSFLNRFFWNELFIAKKNDGTNILDIGKKNDERIDNVSYNYLNDDEKVAYKGLDVYKYDSEKIPLSFFQKMCNVLNNVSKYLECYSIPKCIWDESFNFIPQYVVDKGYNVAIKNNSSETILKVSSLNQVQRIVFFALCKYFDHGEDMQDSEPSLKRWMRVVWNLVSGEDQNGKPQIRSLSAMRTAIDFINKLDCRDVYNSLIKQEIHGKSDFDERCKEEIAKAKQIVEGETRSDGRTWEDVIIEAENYAFFRGSIRFLFRDENGEKNWNLFDKKREIVKKHFDEKGVKEKFKVSLTKALVIQCNKWNDQLYNKQIFNPSGSTWKWILCSDYWVNPINEILLSENIENIKGVANNDDENVKKYITPILSSLPFDYFIQKVPEGRFFWNKGRLGFYKPQGHAAAAFDWENFHRNAILTDLAQKTIITVDAVNMDNSGIFWGWDIFFNYSNNEGKYRFQWNVNSYVRLMDENNLPRKRDNLGEGDDHYYSFKFEGEDTNEFVEKLNEMIKTFVRIVA